MYIREVMAKVNHMNELKLHLIHYFVLHNLLQHFLLQMHDRFQCHHHCPHLPQMKKERPPMFPIKHAQKHKY